MFEVLSLSLSLSLSALDDVRRIGNICRGRVPLQSGMQ